MQYAVTLQRGGALDWRTIDRYRASRLLALVLIGLFADLLLSGPLVAVDAYLMRWSIGDESPWRPLLHVPNGLGQRAITAPFLVVVALGLRWWSRTWRPFVLVIGAIAALNLVVGLLKLGVNRGMPASANPEVFAGGMAWPSGHASNIAMTMAMLIYLAGRYCGWYLGPRARLIGLGVPTGLMCTASAILGYHWLTDLVAGVAVGLLVALGARTLDDDHRRDGDRSSSRANGLDEHGLDEHGLEGHSVSAG